MNKVILIGNLGADAEVRYTQSGSAIATLRLATQNPKNKDGGSVPPTWHTIKVFGKAAEVLSEYGKKGKQLAIEGRINAGTYEKDGEKKPFFEVVCDHFEFVGGNKAEGEQEGSDEAATESGEYPF